MTEGVAIRAARPGDHLAIVRVVDQWWGRPVAAALPRLFLDHFFSTSFVAHRDGELVGFLIGFLSPSRHDEGYIDFSAVHPNYRGLGLARTLYERFFELVRADGRSRVTAVTSPENEASIGFHRTLGFHVEGPIADYNRDGVAMLHFSLSVA